MEREHNCIQRGVKSFYRSAYFSTLQEENKQNPRYLFEAVAKLMKNKASTPDISKQHSRNEFMNFFTYKIDNISEKIITMQLSTTVLH